MVLQYKETSIFYTDAGKGETLVFLHGFLENNSIWKPFIPALSKKNRVICIDLLGHGKTGCLGYIHSMELIAETIEAVLNHLKITKCSIFGHSMGGYVALAFAENNPNKIKALTLINSTAEADSIEKKQNRDRAILAVKKNHKTFIQIAIPNLFTSKNRSIFSDEIEHLKKEALKTPLQGIIAALEGMKIRKDRTHLLLNIAYKKQMIIGKRDPILDYKILINQTKNTEVTVVEFPDGHMSFIENKEELLQNILHFIE
ncbi:alpha/beta fold hydrolase [Hyunsoonleella pacifica]|uniref:Alpha/beta hydrolase n=1 Tax=Hyunsoonleella pacifica TaxID=1080224 RepID=A0A4Q9FNH2_9FLAO|nr:alpha/beta hydrolase [Hyunsoonleella pacifica]TBN15801.1 alpha/beta hydrolase [Hyunsoonleella pacifica]GGD22762.1 alpha/beta hydrolase [Hyunsoonleella pacifica]